MNKLEGIAKRLLNIVTLAAALWLALLMAVAVFGGVSNWSVYMEKNVFPALGALATVGITSYVLFGRFKLWHRGTQPGA